MAKDSRKLDDLSIEELETILARKKLEARGARLRRFRKSGRALRVRREVEPQLGAESFRSVSELTAEPANEEAKPLREGASKLLLVVEIVDAVVEVDVELVEVEVVVELEVLVVVLTVDIVVLVVDKVDEVVVEEDDVVVLEVVVSPGVVVEVVLNVLDVVVE